MLATMKKMDSIPGKTRKKIYENSNVYYILKGFPMITSFFQFISCYLKRNTAKLNSHKHHEMDKTHCKYFSHSPILSPEKAKHNTNRKMLHFINV